MGRAHGDDDDATNRTYAPRFQAEDTRAAMDILGRYARRRAYGLPQALYVDHDSIYECTQRRIDEDLRGEGPQTSSIEPCRFWQST